MARLRRLGDALQLRDAHEERERAEVGPHVATGCVARRGSAAARSRPRGRAAAAAVRPRAAQARSSAPSGAHSRPREPEARGRVQARRSRVAPKIGRRSGTVARKPVQPPSAAGSTPAVNPGQHRFGALAGSRDGRRRARRRRRRRAGSSRRRSGRPSGSGAT